MRNMTILTSPPTNWKRPQIPVSTQAMLLLKFMKESNLRLPEPREWKTLKSLIRLIKKIIIKKLGWKEVNIDHRPDLMARKYCSETNDTIPAANDPNYLEVLSKADHDARTFGRGGTKRITSAGSDANNRAKVRALRKSQAEFKVRSLERKCGQKRT